MNKKTSRYIGNRKYALISSDIFAIRGEYETTFIYERGESSFFRNFRPRYAGPEKARYVVSRK